MNREDKMIQITFKRQRKKRGLELLRLRRNEREMVELLWMGLDATTPGGSHRAHKASFSSFSA